MDKQIEKFENQLKKIDWYYEYASGRQYFDGKRKMEEIKFFMHALLMEDETIKDNVVSLWNKYAPEAMHL